MSKKVQEIEVPKAPNLIEQIWANSEDLKNLMGAHVLEIKTTVKSVAMDLEELATDYKDFKLALSQIEKTVKSFDEKLKAINIGIADILDGAGVGTGDDIPGKEPAFKPVPISALKSEPTIEPKAEKNPLVKYYSIIQSKTELNASEIDEKVEEIVKKYNGLLSRDGAFKQLCRELGIELKS